MIGPGHGDTGGPDLLAHTWELATTAANRKGN